MLKNYLVVAFRNIFRNKLFSFVNIAGLSFGISSAVLIFLWIGDELLVDRFHQDGDRFYRVMENQKYSDGRLYTFSSTPAPMAPFIKDKFPEIELATRVTWQVSHLFEAGEKMFFENGRCVDQDFLLMFSLKFINGDKLTALTDKTSIVVSRSMAEKYFGAEDPLGKVLVTDHEHSFKVTGVFEDLPAQSSWKFSFLLPFRHFWDLNTSWLDQWGNNNIRTWIKLAPGSDPVALGAKLKGEIKEHNAESNVELHIQRFGDAYLYGDWENGVQSGGRIDYVRNFFIVAVFVLLIACINFMNLATAQGARRAKEVGLRKVIGAFPAQLFRQFMGESFLTVALASVIAIVLVFVALPAFNALTGKSMALSLLDRRMILIFLAVLGGTAILAGTYPALFVSGYKPVEVLKGQLASGSKAAIFRKVLVVLQFSFSIVLIISTVVVFRQMKFMQNKNIGFDRNNLIYVWMQGEMDAHWDVVRQQLVSRPGIESVSSSGQMPIDIGNSTYGVEWEGKREDERILFTILSVDMDFISTMKMQMLEGRAYDRAFISDTAGFIVNAVAAAKFGFKGEIAGRALTVWGRKGKIIGVVENFNFGSLRAQIEPLVLRIPTPGRETLSCMLVRVKGNELQQAISTIEQVWKEHAPGYPFSYSFLSQDWEKYYESEGKRGSVFNALAVLSIFISALGLFGLSAYSAARRTKELGIRKVMGASVPGLVGLMGKEFLVLVLIAAAIGCPVGWYMMTGWLNRYAFHVEVGWGALVVASLGCLSVSALTISYHSLKVSRANPAHSLRYE